MSESIALVTRRFNRQKTKHAGRTLSEADGQENWKAQPAKANLVYHTGSGTHAGTRVKNAGSRARSIMASTVKHAGDK